MIYAIHDIVKLLKTIELISPSAIRLQRQLFVTLCLQVCIFEYHFNLHRQNPRNKCLANQFMCALRGCAYLYHSTAMISRIIQTLIPLICLYSPCAVTIIFPLLGLDSHWYDRN